MFFRRKWDDLQLAYFAKWTYLNTPFLFVLPGVETEEIQSWQEDGEAWRRLKVTFPCNHRYSQRSTSTKTAFN
jgi:hypothetical protein